MRDVDVFEKKQKVGEGTYGSVFVARDRKSNEIVALKRINTKQEENGFPITALREVKILKALQHPNIVNLKEIVTSKGAYPRRTAVSRSYPWLLFV
jgi:cyclin-dependent kinase 12/13